jgi:flagellar hook-associated protein 2
MSTSSINLTNSVLDVGSIVDNLIYVDSAPVRQMQSKVTTLQSKVSAYQSLNTKLSALSDKVNTMLFGSTQAPLIQPYDFADRLSDSIFSKCKATSSSNDMISVTSSNATAGGSYTISATNLAKAQSSASNGFADKDTTTIGTGSFEITKGGSTTSIAIDTSNNTLEGLKTAINNADAGVTATIVNDGSASPYKLLIRANDSGTANSFSINAAKLTGGQALTFAPTQGAEDATFSVNGLSVTKSSNTVSDVIEGVTFTLKDESGSPVTITVEQDIDSIVTALKDFVSAYNTVSSSINAQFAYNSTTKTAGVLAGDSTLRQIQSKLQTLITQGIDNRFTSYGVTGQVGIEFNRDGSLTLNETKLRDTLATDFTGVAALFLGNGAAPNDGVASDARVSNIGKTSATQSGTYTVKVNTLAQQALLTGSEIIDSVNGLSNAETLTISSGSLSIPVSLSAGDTIQTILTKINGALTFATATDDGTGKIQIASNAYGSSQTITVSSDHEGAGSAGFTIAPATANGVDITGEIGGNAAIGNGLTLTGALGQLEEGLSVTIAQDVVGDYGTVTLADSGGYEGSSILMNLFSALDGITDPLQGPVHNATDGLNQSISAINDMIASYQTRLDKEREMLTLEFTRADQALRLMSVAQAQLTSQLGSLSSSN